MEQAVHQSLINSIESLLTEKKGIDETQAKTYRKAAEALITEQAEHPLKGSLETSLEQLREQVHKQVEKRDADFLKVNEALAIANDALKQEKLKEAEDATQKALSIAGQIPGLSEQRRAEIDTQLDKIYPRMRKLSAWRHWGTTRAREDLIDQIKQIPGSRMDPNQIVKTLRTAKAQWQDWEKSGDHSEHKLWKTFSDACDTAYEPCREFFKAQKQERKNNLVEKRALIEEIDSKFTDTDWHSPDWKEIDKWLRQARGRFFKIGHTDYKHHKKLREKLDKSLEQFESHLVRERERNLKMRRQLISDIEALAEQEDTREVLAQLEQLRKQWVTTVLDKRGVENKLWKQYQTAQDKIYDRRNSERKEQDHVRQENLKQKRLLVEELTNAAAAPPEDLLAGSSPLARYRERFNEIGYIPRKAEKALMDSWRKAQKDYTEALGKAEKARAQGAQNTLREKARLCADLELKKLQGETLDNEASSTAYQTMPALEAPLEAALQARLTHALSETAYAADTLQANTAAQLSRCIKAEVIRDLPTPDEYTKQRMAFQIERLANSMKKNTRAQESLDSLKLELLTSGPVEEAVHEAIWERIDAILYN